MSSLIVMSHNSHQLAGGETSRIRPSAHEINGCNLSCVDQPLLLMDTDSLAVISSAAIENHNKGL